MMEGNFHQLKTRTEKALKEKTYISKESREKGFGESPDDGKLLLLCSLANFHLGYIIIAENMLY